MGKLSSKWNWLSSKRRTGNALAYKDKTVGKCSFIYIWFIAWLLDTWIYMVQEKTTIENVAWRLKKNRERVKCGENNEEHKGCKNIDEEFIVESWC